MVIKLGGNVINTSADLLPLMQSVKDFVQKGYSVFLIHGGGVQIDTTLQKLHIPIKKYKGRRITNAKTLDAVTMVCRGLINTQLVALCARNGIQAIGLSGVDGSLVQVIKRKPKPIDFGFVGDIQAINHNFIYDLSQANFIPIIASLGIDNKGQVFNINADSLATQVALAVNADALIFVTDVKGIYNTKKIISILTTNQATKLIKTNVITDGMIPKITNAITAIEKGIKQVQIIGNLSSSKQWTDALLHGKYGTLLLKGNLL